MTKTLQGYYFFPLKITSTWCSTPLILLYFGFFQPSVTVMFNVCVLQDTWALVWGPQGAHRLELHLPMSLSVHRQDVTTMVSALTLHRGLDSSVVVIQDLQVYSQNGLAYQLLLGKYPFKKPLF